MTVGIPVWQVAGTARERRPKIDRFARGEGYDDEP